jgi:hypothetical protein
VHEIVPSYSASPDAGQAGLLHIDREAKKPLTAVNGAALTPRRAHLPLKRHA